MAAAQSVNFRDIFDCSPTPLMLMSVDLTIVDMNRSYIAAVGRTRDSLVGRHIFDAFPSTGETHRALRDSLMRVVRTGEPDVLPVLRYPIPVPDETAIEDRYWSCSHVAVRDADGDIAFVLQNTQDVTEFHRSSGNPVGSAARGADKQGAEVLGSSVLNRAERVKALKICRCWPKASSFAGFSCARRASCASCADPNIASNSPTRPSWTTSSASAISSAAPFREAIPEADGQIYLDLLDKVYQSGEAFVGKRLRAEFERVPGEGVEEVFLNFVFQPLIAEDGQVAAIFVDGNEVTDHVRSEKSQALLVRELHHRVRNTLATVQGVMNSTARTAETIEDYQWAFSGRISSLARTHSLLTEEIQQFVSFPHLLRQEVGRLCRGRDRPGRARRDRTSSCRRSSPSRSA